MNKPEPDPDQPRTLREEAARQRRCDMLDLPHIAPLTAYVAKLIADGFGDVPEDFDRMGSEEIERMFGVRR